MSFTLPKPGKKVNRGILVTRPHRGTYGNVMEIIKMSSELDNGKRVLLWKKKV
jgi:hypothetical protein